MTKRKPKAGDLIELAFTYLEDGALFSAARCFREAADEIEAVGKRQNAELEKLAIRRPKTPPEPPS